MEDKSLKKFGGKEIEVCARDSFAHVESSPNLITTFLLDKIIDKAYIETLDCRVVYSQMQCAQRSEILIRKR
jgi:hypothetical protein